MGNMSFNAFISVFFYQETRVSRENRISAIHHCKIPAEINLYDAHNWHSL